MKKELSNELRSKRIMSLEKHKERLIIKEKNHRIISVCKNESGKLKLRMS